MWMRLGRIMAFLMLLIGTLGGVAVRPQDIEELLDVHNRVRAEQSVEREEDEDDD